MTLKKRIQVLLVFLVAVPFLLLLGETYRHGRGTLLRQMREDATHTAKLQAALLDSTFEGPRQAAEGIARDLATRPELDPAAVRALLRATLEQTPGAYGFAVALPDGGGNGKPFVPYVFHDHGRPREASLDSSDYGFWRQEWYARPMAERRSLWSRPYLDRGGGEVPMITFACPIRRDGRIIGLATADISLEKMVATLRQLKPGGNGHVYLVSRDGAVLAHPKLPTLDDPGIATGVPRLGELQGMLDRAGEDTMSTRDPFTHQQAWLVEVPLAPLAQERGGMGWSLIASWPEEVRTRPLADLGKRFLVLYFALGGAALLFLDRSLNDLVSRPISRLAAQARRFAAGDFTELGHPTGEMAELEDLGQALQTLGGAMKDRAEAEGLEAPRPAGEVRT
jgi:sigma-B regulation protein RsbU (phosphoserine phosphatase)